VPRDEDGVAAPPDTRRSRYVGPWRIDVTVRDGTPQIVSLADLARTAARALEAAHAPAPASVGLALTNDAELAALNAEHMGQSGPTDVLSFPILPPEAFPPHPGKGRQGGNAASFPLPKGVRQPIGDVILSVERAIDQAEQGRGGQTGDVHWSAADELRLLVTHGVLHLCGWDHAERAEETAMREIERRLLSG
jgi:probable rRNA maturation factor